MASASLPLCRPAALVGTHPLIEQVRALIRRVAPSDATVLISGESGTGKDIVARLIHIESKRAQGPFVAINCGAIPKDLLESEMFGHERGSFTGAIASRTGLFQLANHGTIFLDEVAEMAPGLQSKLLRVLQEREVQPVGSERRVKIDIRIVAASNKNLELLTAAGRFREDLYYRLNVIPIVLPPLRDCRSDIPGLVEHFLELHNDRHRKVGVRITAEAMLQLVQYDWPGNVRQLENVVERLVILSESGLVQPSDLPPNLHALILEGDIPGTHLGEAGVDLFAVVENFENDMIDKALDRTRGNRRAAASLLGLNRTTLVAKLARRQRHHAAAHNGLEWKSGHGPRGGPVILEAA